MSSTLNVVIPIVFLVLLIIALAAAIGVFADYDDDDTWER